jgi:hypothetical protein
MYQQLPNVENHCLIGLGPCVLNAITNQDIELSKVFQTENAKDIVFTTRQC